MELIRANFEQLSLLDKGLDAESSKGEKLDKLQQMLILTATTSSNCNDAADYSWWKLGFGQCGIIFDITGTPTVVKLQINQRWGDALEEDYNCHRAVFKAITRYPTGQFNNVGVRVPEPCQYFEKNGSWWSSQNIQKLKDAGLPNSIPLPTAGLISERILPIPKFARECLIDLICPPEKIEAAKRDPLNNDCLLRVYLGRHQTNPRRRAPNFSLRNFNLHINQMRQLNLPVHGYARDIAETLAILHWAAHINAYDVEFVIGSEPWYAQGSDYSKRLTRIWVLDFNLCTRLPMDQLGEEPGMADSILEMLVLGFFENDPYYPLPLAEAAEDQELWEVFWVTYLGMADKILDGESNSNSKWAVWARGEKLPERFIERCVEREKKYLGDGKGHGYREEKQ